MTGPRKASESSLFPKEQRLEFRRLREAILELLHTWADIETHFSVLLGEILGDVPRAPLLASAIYFAPSGIDARFRIVDGALTVAIRELDARDHVAALWARLLVSLNRSKNVRNAVAHGQISLIIGNRKRRSQARLLPPAGDIFRLDEKIQRRQLPGLSSNDLRQSARKAYNLAEAVGEITRWLAAARRSDTDTSREILAGLEDRLRTSDPQQGAPKKPKRPRPPRSSRA